jgi:UDP-glucose 4-epimerase
MNEVETVFHIAANPEVNASKATPSQQFRQNIEVTYIVLESMRRSDVKEIVFTSTSTVYGEHIPIPTPENYGPLVPISLYGATKLSDEALISAYANMYGFKATIYRLANVIGPRSNHGVI